MSFKLRPYQQIAVDSAIAHIKKSIDSGLLELATGAGKSLIVASLAEWLEQASGKKVLCLAPSKELVQQNREKYLLTGNPASLWCASAGKKDMLNSVVFGSPQSVANDIDKFGDQFCAVIIDEAHGLSDTVKNIVYHLCSKNSKMRVIGLSATPYRMGTGYIYEIDENGKFIDESQAKDPFFKKLICRVTANELLELGYLTQPTTQQTVAHYDTSGLKKDSRGQFTRASVEQAFKGMGRVTSQIVAQVVDAAHDRKGVMFFASSIEHGQEIMASLPKNNSVLVSGKLKKSEREEAIKGFLEQRIKYIVNVDILTTGFDATHVDLIAILRATESAALLQQIIGRGLRLHDGKQNVLIMDFAENIERHGLEDDLFKPEIKVTKSSGEGAILECTCPLCGKQNEFSKRFDPQYNDLPIDIYGYYCDLAGNRITLDDKQEMPAHYGRRCNNGSLVNGKFERCEYRWSSKECVECGHHNDIAARRCESCKCEIVDPNEKLKLEFKRIKESPYETSTDKVLGWSYAQGYTQNGNKNLRIDFTTEYRTFAVWYMPNGSVSKRMEWEKLSQAVFGTGRIAPDVDAFINALINGHGKMPSTITCRRQQGSNFYTVYGYNAKEDKLSED